MFYTDSTHLKASANKNCYDIHQVEQKPSECLAELDAEVVADRLAHGKKPLKEHYDDDGDSSKEIKVSSVDPDAGYMVRDGKLTGFFSLDHRIVDGVHALITDPHITPANGHDSQPCLSRLDRMRQRVSFDV